MGVNQKTIDSWFPFNTKEDFSEILRVLATNPNLTKIDLLENDVIYDSLIPNSYDIHPEFSRSKYTWNFVEKSGGKIIP